jgi:hypothetical protein
MFGGLVNEYAVEAEINYRHPALHPANARWAAHQSELSHLRHARSRPVWWRAPVNWLGDRLVTAGERLHAWSTPTTVSSCGR